ncbi:MAG: ABC transporter substrate-binding protein [Natronomonas sp.]|uniref:ABC transporter substrate-binding protein n=1 Tax=Natronomonas sp. TaxID=2184060 RepID=UPI00286FD8FF|nr:ABC transporter substrate-binding protein [Natronomonas sp.]MDR9380424.1 ABC transporter substrate-binding protein [Natronomonas sp.]MDR9430906.1 ABC transporter substrate-binding protein [Natronomonas sp.]
MPPRVVSLLPSATEIVAALGVEPVATSHECDYPPRVRDAPSVVKSRIDASTSSAEIDAQVQESASEGGVYRIDREALAAAAPDVVISQGICEVCAVDTVAVESAIEELGLNCELVTTDPHSVGDILRDIESIGDALGRRERAAELVDELRARIDRIATTAAESPIEPSVAVLDWLDPPMVAGHWVPELVELAGGEYGLADPGDASTPREWVEIRDDDPDILVAAPCGFELDQIAENRSDLTAREGWSSLRAVRMNRAYAMDGHHLTNRPGPRVVETLETLAALLQPEHFDVPEPWMATSLPELG